MIRKAVAVLAIVATFSGCAASQKNFLSASNSLDDTKVCRNYLKDRDKLRDSYRPDDATEASYLTALEEQVDRRNLHHTRCQQLVSAEDERIGAAIALGIVAVGVATIAVKSGGGGGGGGYTAPQPTGYAWDQFYDADGDLTWRCRDRSNGRFANNYRCGAFKSDTTWPGK